MYGKVLKFTGAHSSQVSAFLALLVLMVALSFAAPNFLTVNNILSILHQVTYVAILAVGLTFLILSGQIDLSASATLALSICIMGDLYANRGVNGFLAFFIGLSVGVFCGFINGLFITKLRLIPFIVTLATMNIYRGIASVYTNGYSSQGMPELVSFIGKGKIGGIPVSVLVMLTIYVVSWFVLTKTSFGLNMQAVGGNMSAAKLSGINVDRTRILAFMYSGMTAFFAGAILAGRMDTTNAGLADGAEMNCIAAAVIGGTSMSGGIGSVWGTMIGAVLMGVLNNGMNQLGISAFWQKVFMGAIVLLAVTLDSLRNKKKTA